jgi:glucosamine--fructose-6-phosphate aminotransferase (isomerizing)
MCGIVGAASHTNIVDVLVEGLRRLEYRGYDSCGFAVINGDDPQHPIERARTTARVSELAEQGKDFHGTLGIAHTRWATHGKPDTQNAHPHISNGLIAVVHNGIIENYEVLRAESLPRTPSANLANLVSVFWVVSGTSPYKTKVGS